MQAQKAHTFPSRCTDGNFVTRFEQPCLGDRVMNLCFKDEEETLFAYLLSRLRSLQDGFGLLAQSARRRGHDRLSRVSSVRSEKVFGVYILLVLKY